MASSDWALMMVVVFVMVSTLPWKLVVIVRGRLGEVVVSRHAVGPEYCYPGLIAPRVDLQVEFVDVKMSSVRDGDLLVV